jgi:hypothetical protein
MSRVRPADRCPAVHTLAVGGQLIRYRCVRPSGHGGFCRCGGIELGRAPVKPVPDPRVTSAEPPRSMDLGGRA